MSQVQVRPSALTALAGVFDAQAATLAAHAGTFRTDADQVAQAFGLLGVCDHATQKYRELLSTMVQALDHLGKGLTSDSEGLRATARSYADTDHAIAEHLRSVHPATQAGPR